MIYLIATICGILGGAALGFGWGLMAATLYSNIAGARDGGPAMAGFYYVGPFGLIAGFLLTAGFILKSNLGESLLGKFSIWGGFAVMGLGLIVFLLPWLNNGSQASAKFVLTMQYEVPATTNADRYKWGYQGEAECGFAEYPFHTKESIDSVQLLSGDMQMSDFPDRRFAYFAENTRQQKFEVPVVGAVYAATEWSPWIPGDGVRFRWRIH
jgi:hypothetical protein